MKQIKNKSTLTLPSVSKGKTTGNPPTQNKRIHKKKIVDKIVLVKGLLFTLENEIKIKHTNGTTTAVNAA